MMIRSETEEGDFKVDPVLNDGDRREGQERRMIWRRARRKKREKVDGEKRRKEDGGGFARYLQV